MDSPEHPVREPDQPGAPWRVLAGLVSALAAVGVGHGVAAFINPLASPLIAVGSGLVDAAPTPARSLPSRRSARMTSRS